MPNVETDIGVSTAAADTGPCGPAGTLSSPIGSRLLLTSMSKAQPCHLAASTATCAASGETTIADDQALPVQHDGGQYLLLFQILSLQTCGPS